MRILIKNQTVKKIFPTKYNLLFENEVFWLNKLSKFEIAPKILEIDYKNQIIHMSYEGEEISKKNAPNNWPFQLKKILNVLKKNNCLHSDIKPDNLLVKNNKLKLIDFAQSCLISNLKKDIFLKKRIFFDEYSFKRINLSINKNLITSNDLRTIFIWDTKNQNFVEKKIKKNKNIEIIDKIKIEKNFFTEKYKDRIFWVDQFYNKNVSKKSEKLKDNIFVYVVKSINPIFKSHTMIFEKEKKFVDDKIFVFKKNIRKNKLSFLHISDNFEEAKRNAIFISKTKNNFPAKYFFQTQHVFENKKQLFKKLNKTKKLKYVVLRKPSSEKDDLDILVNDYFLFKRVVDSHSYKTKNLNFISNSGDPVDENGFKVANYIRLKNKLVKVDVRFVGDDYFDKNWQKKILIKTKFNKDYKVPNRENFLYSLLYHIVYHKGYIDRKYNKILKKHFKFKILDLETIKETINDYLKLKNYKVTRSSDLTIPITYPVNKILLIKEIKQIRSQIEKRNFSGANKMILNVIRFQNFFVYANINFIFVIFLNQFILFKSKFKNLLLKYFSFNE